MHLRIDPSSPTPVYQQLVERLRSQVALGVLRPEDQLPSVRELAMELVINPNTVQKAYTELTSQGLIYSRKGVGVFVSTDRPSLSQKEKDKHALEAADHFITECIHLGLSASDIQVLVSEELKKFRKGESP